MKRKRTEMKWEQKAKICLNYTNNLSYSIKKIKTVCFFELSQNLGRSTIFDNFFNKEKYNGQNV